MSPSRFYLVKPKMSNNNFPSENDTILLETNHPTVKEPKPKWFIFFIALIPFFFHTINFGSRSDQLIWYTNLVIELLIMIVSFLLGVGLLQLTHRTMLRSARNSENYMINSYFTNMGSGTTTVFLILMMGEQFYGEYVAFNWGMINLTMIVLLALIYTYLLVEIFIHQLKNTGRIYLVEKPDRIELLHRFNYRQLSISFEREFDKNEKLPIAIMNLVKTNDRLFNRSFEYQSISHSDLVEGMENISLYLPINENEWVLVADFLDYSQATQLLEKIGEVIELVGLKITLPKSKDNLFDYYEGRMVTHKTIETKKYKLSTA